jgi:zinc transporter 1/2/3
MNLQILKLLAAVVLWAVIFGFGLIPIKWKRVRSNKRAMAYSNCFSGGLFVAIGLIHILPESHFYLEAQQEHPTGKHQKQPFPLSYVICLLTFSLLLFIDKIWLNNLEVAASADEARDDLHRQDTKRTHDHRAGEVTLPKKFREDKLRTKEQRIEDMEDEIRRQLSITQKLALNFRPTRAAQHKYCCKEDHVQQRASPDHQCSESDVSGSICESSFVVDSEEEEPIMPEEKKAHLALIEEESERIVRKETTHHHHVPIIGAESNTIRVYIILVAMGIHGVFSGLALGVTLNKEDLFYLFLAMLFHKWSEAFTVGISFVKSKVPERRATFLILLFSVFTPLGIFIGVLIPSTNMTLIGVCFALSAGSFLYIAFAEIILDEFSMSTYRYTKFLFYLLGIGFVTWMGTLED